MKKIMNWMFAAILLCGASVCITSCDDDEDSLLSNEYSFDCTLEMVTQGELTSDNVATLEAYLNKQKSTNKFKSLYDAKNALDNVVDALVKDIDNRNLYSPGTKYIVYVRLYDSRKYQVYQRHVIVDGVSISVKGE